MFTNLGAGGKDALQSPKMMSEMKVSESKKNADCEQLQKRKQLLLLLKIKQEKLSANTGGVTIRKIMIDLIDFLKFLNSSINRLGSLS